MRDVTYKKVKAIGQVEANPRVFKQILPFFKQASTRQVDVFSMTSRLEAWNISQVIMGRRQERGEIPGLGTSRTGCWGVQLNREYAAMSSDDSME